MKRSQTLACLALLSLTTPAIQAASEIKPRSIPTTVAHTVVNPNYKRERLDSGQWKPERYALGMGKTIDPTQSDSSLTALSVQDMAEILAHALANENYIAESEPDQTDLLIVVNWGKTIPHTDGIKTLSIDGMSDAMNSMTALSADIEQNGPSSAANSELGEYQSELETFLLMQDMAQRARRQANEFNAQLLGFAPDLFDYYQSNPVGGPQRQILDDLVEEIEYQRYFVILVAYDFQKLIQNKEKEIQWITRFSIRARDRSFNEELENMARAASSQFGQKTQKIRRNLLPGKIEMGELEVVETLESENE